MKRELRNNRES